MIDEQTILSTLGIYKIKYSVLDKLDIKKINSFHIDINSVISSLFRLKDLDDIKQNFDCTFSIASSILNLAAHFRAYFIKRGWDVKIYLYYDEKNIKEHPLNKFLFKALEFVKIISSYIPKLYFINDENNISLMKYFIDQDKKVLIFTKNLVYYQFIRNNVTILRPARDDSYIVTKDNIFNKISNTDKEYSISIELITAILSISGVNDYKGIPKMGIKKTVKLFQKAIDDKKIINHYYPVMSVILDELGFGYEHGRDVINAFASIEYKQQTVKNIDKLSEKYIIDKFSKRDIQELNTKYFTGFNSLMLQELLLQPKQSNNKNKIDW